MQLIDVLTLAAREGMRRHVEKRAGIVLPIAIGAQVPGIAHRAMERAHSTEHALTQSNNQYDQSMYGGHPKMAALPPWLALPMAQMAHNPMGAARAAGPALGAAGKALGGNQILNAPGQGIGQGLSKMFERKMFGQDFGEKRDPLHMGAGAAVTSFGKEMGTSGANLLRDIANKAMEAAGHAGDASAREAIIGDLKKTDSVLANADDTTLMEAYHTMTRFAPVLSTDKNAVRSFLRQAVMSGSGPDFMSIKLISDAEHSVTGDKVKR